MDDRAEYFPPPERQGGWRWLDNDDQISEIGGFDPQKLSVFFRIHDVLYGGYSWSTVIIRHGWLVSEFSTFNVAPSTRFDTWSITKSITATAWGMLLGDSENGLLPGNVHVALDTPAYSLIEEGHPLSDKRKERITVDHLLTMTSGIAGEDSAIFGMPAATNSGIFEHALGFGPNRYGQWVDTLLAEPGTHWEYSDPAYSHLSIIFEKLAGQEMAGYMDDRLFGPMGIDASWDAQGASGFLGPHTNAHTGFHVSARDLARIGYLALHQGVWNDRQLVPSSWIERTKVPSQEMNPAYSYGWWTNARDKYVPGAPYDLFALAGYASNRCYIVPSLDLVVARVGSGPARADEASLIMGVIKAII